MHSLLVLEQYLKNCISNSGGIRTIRCRFDSPFIRLLLEKKRLKFIHTYIHSYVHSYNIKEFLGSLQSFFKFKFFKRQTIKLRVRANFLSERLINCWNSLPHTVDLSSFSKFKRTEKGVDFTIFSNINLHYLLISFMQYVVCIATLLFD